jgi:hypothetical protein
MNNLYKQYNAMKGILTRNEDGIWMVKWSDLHSFAHGTHWMYTELSSDSNSIRYVKDNLVMYKPLEEGLNVEFEMVTSGYHETNYTPFNSAKLIFPEVDIFEKEQAKDALIELYEQQIMDLTIMSKIELGDDVITEIKRLKELIGKDKQPR